MKLKDWQDVINQKEIERVNEVANLYGLSKVILHKNTAGGANYIYRLTTKHGKFILRQSHISAPGALNLAERKQHLNFQAETLVYLEQQKFSLVPKVYKNIDGQYVTVHKKEYFMLFSYAKGSRKGKWDDLKNITPIMFKNIFFALGSFDRALKDFSPTHATKERNILDYAKISQQWLAELMDKVPSPVSAMVGATLPALNRLAKENLDLLKSIGYSSLPRQVVHFDCHAGNIYFVGDKVSAILDPDWIRLDCRFADLAIGLSMSCPFKGPYAGKYNKARFATARKAYRQAFGPNDYSYQEEGLITKAALRSCLFFQLLYDLEHQIGNKTPEFDVIHYQLNTLLANDFDQVFS